VTQQLADRLFQELKDDPLTGAGKMTEAPKSAVRGMGLEINEKLGSGGMVAVFEYLEPSLTEKERSAIDRIWNGIGGWMT
jgi:hypothetical protein